MALLVTVALLASGGAFDSSRPVAVFSAPVVLPVEGERTWSAKTLCEEEAIAPPETNKARIDEA